MKMAEGIQNLWSSLNLPNIWKFFDSGAREEEAALLNMKRPEIESQIKNKICEIISAVNQETQELFPDWRIVADFKVAPGGDVCLTRVYAQERRVSRYGGGSRERIIEWNGEEISGTENGKPWEDIQVLSAPVLSARLTQDYLFKGLKDLFDQIKDLIKEPLSEAGAP
jgi:hypothetical protein